MSTPARLWSFLLFLSWVQVAEGAAVSRRLECPIEHGDTETYWGNYRARLHFPSVDESPLVVPLPELRFREVAQAGLRSFTTDPVARTTFRNGAHRVELMVWSTALDASTGGAEWLGPLRILVKDTAADQARAWVLDYQSSREGDALEGGLPTVERLDTGPLRLPLFLITWRIGEHGHTAGLDTTQAIVVDARSSPPSVMAALECSWGDVRQSCEGGHKETAFWQGNSIGCAWHARHNSLECTNTEYAGTAWGDRFWSSSVGRPRRTRLPNAAPQVDKARGPIGPLSTVARLPRGSSGGDLLLLGARGDHLQFDPRFFVTDGANASPVEVRLLDPDAMEPASDHQLWLRDPSAMPARGGPRFHVVQRWRPRQGLEIIEVVATEGGGQGLYLVGVEQGRRLIAHAVRLASNAAYPFCGGLAHPASATSVRVMSRGRGSRVQMTMEPAWFDTGGMEPERDREGYQSQHRCPWTATAEWRSGEGFEWSDAPSTCATETKPRRVIIHRTGRIDSVAFSVPY